MTDWSRYKIEPCENCGHDGRIGHFARLGQIICLTCNDCVREYHVEGSKFIEGKWLVRKGDFD